MKNKALLICLNLSIMFFTLTPVLANAEIQVVAIGDSITADYPYLQDNGNGCRCPQEGFEVQLEAKLNASGMPANVYNYGNPGDSTFGMLKRIEQILDQVNPDTVLLLGGTNDIAFFSPTTIASNLAAMVDKVRDYKAEPIIGTLTPDTNPANSFKNIPVYNQYIIDMANNRNVKIADHYSTIVDTWKDLTIDGLHLTKAGNNVLAQNWFNSLSSPKDADGDGDGYTIDQRDCDDTNPNVYPFAFDVCGDGIDQDCDGSDRKCPSITPLIILLLDEKATQ